MRVSELWLPVRWSDGRPVRHTVDAAALMLRLSSTVTTVAGLVGIWLLDNPVFWWVLVASVPLGVAAQLRLRHVARTREAAGSASGPPPQQTRYCRLCMWMAGRCDIKEAKLLTRADAARTERAADRYRRRAGRERDWAQKCRDQATAARPIAGRPSDKRP